MGKETYNWLKRIQGGKGKEIARVFFWIYTSEENVTFKFHPEAHKKNSKKCLNPKSKKEKVYKKVSYIDRNINKICREWEKEGFLDIIEVKLPVHNRWKKKHKQLFPRKIMNLEPLYRYCKEMHNIEFNEKEKVFLNRLLSPTSQTRWLCLFEYPNEDIINAILKFYIKHFPMPYNELYRMETLFKYPNISLSKEYVEILKEAEKNAEEISKLDVTKDEKPHKAEDFFNKLEEQTNVKNLKGMEGLNVVTKNLIKVILHSSAYFYVTNIKLNPQMVASVDSKFMKILGILP